jgi:hypothetical protein
MPLITVWRTSWGHSALIQKFGKVDSFGQPCTTTPKTLYRGVLRVRNMGVSMQEMPSTHHQLSVRALWCLGNRLYGTISKSRQCEYILVAVDYISKWVESLPCWATDSNNAKRMFLETIFPRFKVPRMVISDGGHRFIDRKFQRFLSDHGVRHNIATSYHPQTSR